VHLAGPGWRETKNASLIRATGQTFAEDPQPDPPTCFRDAKHVVHLAETQALSLASARPPTPDLGCTASTSMPPVTDSTDNPPEAPDWRPKRQVRTVLSSMADSDTFGPQMAREAKRRCFFQATRQAFLGDGLSWNWSIWKRHFRRFTPILDFIHVLSYLFTAARAVHVRDEDAWSQYLAWMQGCWRGEVDQVLAELRVWRERLGPPLSQEDESSPAALVAKTIGYLENNRSRMDYPRYRRQGLPVTTAWMESLVKEMNYRVKGTEMFWNDPAGAEAILQVRAAALSDDDRLGRHLRTRPGCALVRRSSLPKPSAQNCKS
jgi:hypothetical protein